MIFIWDELVLYITTIVITAALSHLTLRGIEATQRRARQTVFWPGISADMDRFVNA